ncbi:MAG: hypothetical protein J7L14_03545 [Candidatus Diapherotrites archaeon]|nr:hypothetical protein [Candidatus Diapherotrites archaeon]
MDETKISYINQAISHIRQAEAILNHLNHLNLDFEKEYSLLIQIEDVLVTTLLSIGEEKNE